jgi:hypothetical protein
MRIRLGGGITQKVASLADGKSHLMRDQAQRESVVFPEGKNPQSKESSRW